MISEKMSQKKRERNGNGRSVMILSLQSEGKIELINHKTFLFLPLNRNAAPFYKQWKRKRK